MHSVFRFKFKLHFNWQKFCTEKVQFLTLKRSLHSPKDIQREWRLGESKKRVKSLRFANIRRIKDDHFFLLPFSGKLSSVQFPFQTWQRRSTPRVNLTITYCTVLGTYATISLWSIWAAHTEFLPMWQRILSYKLFFQKGREVLIAVIFYLKNLQPPLWSKTGIC